MGGLVVRRAITSIITFIPSKFYTAVETAPLRRHLHALHLHHVPQINLSMLPTNSPDTHLPRKTLFFLYQRQISQHNSCSTQNFIHSEYHHPAQPSQPLSTTATQGLTPKHQHPHHHMSPVCSLPPGKSSPAPASCNPKLLSA